MRHRLAALAAAAVLAAVLLPGSAPAQSTGGTVERIRVHGPSLEGNLAGDDATRDVFVYLPPSYRRETARRYPVVYFLHGYAATAESYVRSLDLPLAADRAIAAGVRETIIVLPDAFTSYSGSLYSSSATIGDWETFVATDLVAHIDGRYRTLAQRESRGLAGHSMGGYGTMRIGMKRADAFGALYAMSSCCLLLDPARATDPAMRAARAGGGERPRGPPDPAAGFANALAAQAAAWAPNPDAPPQFFDWPFENGAVVPAVAAKWLANAPLVMVDQYAASLRRYGAIALDVGDADPLRADNVDLDAALTRLRVPHTFEQYEGDHGNRVRERFAAKVLPFFSQSLATASARGAVSIGADGSVTIPGQTVPMTPYLSDEGKQYLIEHLHGVQRPELLVQDSGVPPLIAGYLDRQRVLYPHRRNDTRIGGVHVYDYTPASGIAPENRRRVLVNLHGGGFSGCWPGCAELESIPVASVGRIRVVSVDYRQAPEHVHPAASEDVAAVYRELLKTYRPENIGLFGCSAGGMLTAMSVAWFQQHDLPPPGAVGVLCSGAGTPPGVDFFGGDAAYAAMPTGEARMRGADAQWAYFARADMSDALVAPIAHARVLAGFPPTVLVSGTRAAELSSAAYTHTQLVKAGVDARLHVWEGMFHGFFYNPDVPESQEVYRVIADFFARNLGSR
jgi:acetyl esterase/lipase/S-formylglutathione hydrolase FrmB